MLKCRWRVSVILSNADWWVQGEGKRELVLRVGTFGICSMGWGVP